jgi:GDPmannose 4,6-dehydratase
MWLMMQKDKPDDYVLATGETHSVREFVEKAFKHVGIEIGWKGKGVEEVGFDAKSGKVYVEVDARYFRPTEVDLLLGDPSKAHRELGWRHETGFDALVEEMMTEDITAMGREWRRNAD